MGEQMLYKPFWMAYRIPVRGEHHPGFYHGPDVLRGAWGQDWYGGGGAGHTVC